MKTAKFIIGDNPLIDDGRVYVIHLRSPLVVAEAFHFDLHEEDDYDEARREFSMGASVDYPGELIFLGVIYVGDLPEAYTAQETADKLAKLMSRMGDWYHAYLSADHKILLPTKKTT